MTPEDIRRQIANSLLDNILRMVSDDVKPLIKQSSAAFIDAIANNNQRLFEERFIIMQDILNMTQQDNEHQQPLDFLANFKKAIQDNTIPQSFMLLYLTVFKLDLAVNIKNQLLDGLESIGVELDKIINKKDLINNLNVAIQNLHHLIAANIPESPDKNIIIEALQVIDSQYVSLNTAPNRPKA